MKKDYEPFIGFPKRREPNNFWCYPRIMDNYWCHLKGSEQKVLDFILRRTWGFSKLEDKISLTQIESGVRGFDKGTGLSRTQIVRSLKTLEEKGFIKSKKGGWINTYSLVTLLNQDVTKSNQSRNKKSSGSNKNEHHLSTKSKHTINKPINKKTIEIYNNYKNIICSQARLTKSGREKIDERLEFFSSEELEKAIKNFSESVDLMEKFSHAGVKWFFDSDDRIDGFINLDSYYGFVGN